MAGHHYETVENNVTGKPVNGATVLVYEDGATKVGDAITSGALATIYSDDGITLIDQAASPILTDNRGFYEFWTDETVVALAFLYEGLAKRAIIDVEILGGTVSSDVTALAARVDKHDTVFGLAANATNLGTFTGSTITDNDDVKGALQSLETAVESGAGTLDGLGTMAVENTTSYYTQTEVDALVAVRATGTWNQLSAATASSSSSLDFTGIDPTAYDEFQIVAADLVLSGAAELHLIAGTGAGPTWDTGANYDLWVNWQFGTTSTGTASRAFVSATTAGIRFGTVSSASSAAGVPMSGTSEITGLASGSHLRLIRMDMAYDGSGGWTPVQSGGIHNDTTAVTGLRLAPSTGTITSGRAVLFGRKFT